MSFQKIFKAGDKVIELKRGMAVSVLDERQPRPNSPYVLQTKKSTYTPTGHVHDCDQRDGSAPDLVEATPENAELLKKLFPDAQISIETTTVSDLGEKLGKKTNDEDFAFMAFVSDESNEEAIRDGRESLTLIVGYEESHDYKFRTLDHTTWKFAVPVNNDLSIMTDDEPSADEPSADEPSADEPSALKVGDKVRLVKCCIHSRFNVGDEFTVTYIDLADGTYAVDAGFWLMKIGSRYSLFLRPSEVFEKV